MSLIDSIKKIFVSPSKEEDIKEKEFENPLDRMPIANGTNRYAPPARMAELEAEINPRPEEEMAEWFSDRKEKPDESDEIEEEIADDFAIENPDESDEIEEEKMTMHEKMYRIATAKYNPFAIGGSETLGGSENRT